MSVESVNYHSAHSVFSCCFCLWLPLPLWPGPLWTCSGLNEHQQVAEVMLELGSEALRLKPVVQDPFEDSQAKAASTYLDRLFFKVDEIRACFTLLCRLLTAASGSISMVTAAAEHRDVNSSRVWSDLLHLSKMRCLSAQYTELLFRGRF